MDAPGPNGDQTEPSAGAVRPLWQRVVRVVAVLVVVGLALMAFASWYYTNTFDFVFGPPR
jgi:hypothetical protein